MTEAGGLEAVYFPDSHVRDAASFTSYCLTFDRVHLVHVADLSTDPTEYLSRTMGQVTVTALSGEGDAAGMAAFADHYRFAQSIRPLIGPVVRYHPHLIAQETERLVSAMLDGELDPTQLVEALTGDSPLLRDFTEFLTRYPEIEGEMAVRIVPTALSLARRHGWSLVGDDPTMDVPRITRRDADVAQLTALLAPECVRVALPRCTAVEPETVLEVREHLQEQLIPFRLGLRRLTSQIRAGLDGPTSISDIQAEARFLAESEIEPALHQFKKRVERAESRLLVRVFGKVVGWMPLIAKVFAIPTGDSLYGAMAKVYGDVGSLAEDVQEASALRDPEVAYLLDLSRRFG